VIPKIQLRPTGTTPPVAVLNHVSDQWSSSPVSRKSVMPKLMTAGIHIKLQMLEALRTLSSELMSSSNQLSELKLYQRVEICFESDLSGSASSLRLRRAWRPILAHPATRPLATLTPWPEAVFVDRITV
jgi:hypothetical protein